MSEHEHKPVDGTERQMLTICYICYERIVPDSRGGWSLFEAAPTEVHEVTDVQTPGLPYSDTEMIRLALRLATGTRLTDLCNELGVSTATGNALKDRWADIALGDPAEFLRLSKRQRLERLELAARHALEEWDEGEAAGGDHDLDRLCTRFNRLREALA